MYLFLSFVGRLVYFHVSLTGEQFCFAFDLQVEVMKVKVMVSAGKLKLPCNTSYYL